MKFWKLIVILVKGNLYKKLEEARTKCYAKWCKMIGINNVAGYKFNFDKLKPITERMDITEAEWINAHNCLVIYEICEKQIPECKNRVSLAIVMANAIMKIEERLSLGNLQNTFYL